MEQCKEHSGCLAEIDSLKHDNQEVWKAIDTIRTDIKQLVNRPPVWCTAVISLLAAAAAWFAK